jgi:hypothetical protein
MTAQGCCRPANLVTAPALPLTTTGTSQSYAPKRPQVAVASGKQPASIADRKSDQQGTKEAL